MADDPVLAMAHRLMAAGEQAGGEAPEPVSAPLIRQWCAAIGDRNPVYTDEVAAAASVHGGLVAPPAMVQVWTMPGLGRQPGEIAAHEVLAVLSASGYAGVVATNCEQSYDRYLRPGERLRTTTRMGRVTGPTRTALGDGYFVTWHTTWYSGDERVARMMFRVLQFRPLGQAAPGGQRTGAEPGMASALAQAEHSARTHDPAQAEHPAQADATAQADGAAQGRRPEPALEGYPLRPAMNQDTRFFWAGTEAGELRIQRCLGCGTLRHPPGPMCPCCHGSGHDHVVASGLGEVFSYVVHHHPPVPGRKAPFVVAVVQLPEGVRVTGNVLGVPPDQVRVGMPVEVMFERVDSELVLPQWRPAGDAADVLPELVIPLTRTTVVTTAIATRDFTPVHHDPAAARAQGLPDVFLNILTTMGLTQRFVTDWAGPQAIVQAIAVRLGAPAHPGDTLRLTGRVADRGEDGSVSVQIRGACSLGDHVTATVSLRPAGVPR